MSVATSSLSQPRFGHKDCVQLIVAFISGIKCLLIASSMKHSQSSQESPRRYGPGSSVGITTELWAGRSEVESRWGLDFPPVQTGPGAHPASCKMGTGSYPGVKCGRGVLLTTHPLLVPRSWKSRAIPLPTLWATPGL